MNTHTTTVESLLVHREWVRSLARHLVQDDARADDLEQQTWLRALASPPPSGSASRAWLGTIARNLARDLARRRERRARRELAAAHPEALPATVDVVGRAEALGRVVQAVVALEEPYRTTVLLRFFEGLPPRDVATRMDVPVETMRTRLRRALAQLRGGLDDTYAADGRAALPALLLLLDDPASAATRGLPARTLLRGGAAALVLLGVTGGLWRFASSERGSDLVPAAPIETGEGRPRGERDTTAASASSPARKGGGRSERAVADLVSHTESSDSRARPASDGKDTGGAPGGVPVRVEPRPEDVAPPDVLRPTPRPGVPAGDAAAGSEDAPSATGGAVAAAPPSYSDDETTAFEARFEKQLDKAARDVVTTAKWCADHQLEWTGQRTLREALRYRPDDVAVRASLGYVRDGAEWAADTAVRDRLRGGLVDEADPAGAAYVRIYGQLQKRLSDAFFALAQQAERTAARCEDDRARVAWKALAARGWERVLELEPGLAKHRDAAHTALDHPTFEGRFVTPTQLHYMTRRAERSRRGAAVRAGAPTVTSAPVEGTLLARAGIEAVGARTEHFTVFSAFGEDVARRQAQAAERALADGIAEYGFPATALDRIALRNLHGVKRDAAGKRDDLTKVLSAAGWDAARIRTNLDAGFGGMRLSASDQVMTTTDGPDAVDFAMNVVHSEFVRAAATEFGAASGRRLESPEDWLWQSMGYECTQRIEGTTLTLWGALGDYARRTAPRPGQSVWIELAREQVEFDDDVPLTRLVHLGIARQEFRGPEIVKGFAFLQFLLEDDPDAAQRFVRLALPLGTPIAAMEVYGKAVLGDAVVEHPPAELANPARPGQLPEPYRRVLDDLDRRYRAWIEQAW